MTPIQVVADLINTSSEAEWNAICERVKRDGKYPEWWRECVIATGLRLKVAKFWRAAQRAAK